MTVQKTTSIELAPRHLQNQFLVLVDGLPTKYLVQPSDYHDDYLHLPKGWDVIFPDHRWTGPFPTRDEAALTAANLWHKDRLVSARLALYLGEAA